MISFGLTLMVVGGLGAAVLAGLTPLRLSLPVSEAHGFVLVALFASAAVLGLVVTVAGVVLR